MKTFITSLLIVFITAFILGCRTNCNLTTNVIVLRDVTDRFNSLPASKEVMSLYDFEDKALWGGKEFHYTTISDVSFNRQISFSLPQENKWLGNELKRKKDIAAFKEGISNALTFRVSDSTGRIHSSVYLPLTKSLEKLSASNSANRILVVYSDLMENGNALSFYDEATYALIKDDPAKVERKLNAIASLPVLQGIVIYIIYEPLSSEDDEYFNLVSSFYKQLLEKKGANVHIQANL